MCAPVYFSLLRILLATLTISIMCGTKMVTEGLPLTRLERSAQYDDVLAGADFLSVFMESSLRGVYKDPTTTTAPPTYPPEPIELDQERTEQYIRTSRQATTYQTDIIAQTTDSHYNSDFNSDTSDGVIVAVRVSSSVGSRDNNKIKIPDITTTTEFFDERIVPLEEDQSSFVAKSSKSELSVEESEPVTSDSDQSLSPSEISRRSFPSTVQGLPNSQQHLNFNPTTFLNQENKAPFHHSFIYHDSPKDPGQARSVSYSTVIQSVPQTEKSTGIHERRERNYDNQRSQFINSFHDGQKNDTKMPTLPQNYAPIAPSSSIIGNTQPNDQNNWQNPEQNYHETSTKQSQTTEKNWERPPPHPKVYGRPEQNYEVDEAVSVVTNGRTHGVQPSPLPNDKTKTIGVGDKKDDNQKVGYVVEGRNYRKYRVEERTADGFIVGEYGVVSHDDGSLRGVRYTADGTINPRLIYDALMKFLSL